MLYKIYFAVEETSNRGQLSSREGMQLNMFKHVNKMWAEKYQINHNEYEAKNV